MEKARALVLKDRVRENEYIHTVVYSEEDFLVGNICEYIYKETYNSILFVYSSQATNLDHTKWDLYFEVKLKEHSTAMLYCSECLRDYLYLYYGKEPNETHRNWNLKYGFQLNGTREIQEVCQRLVNCYQSEFLEDSGNVHSIYHH